uniref:Coatomer subunit beta' n=1 Tax=Rhabditophanes sp. KR3021 TaxID=114890 RepID=A0AC35TLA9_9BILA
MPLKLDVKRKLLARSDRVKCVDLHPTEPWALVCLYNGHAHIWNYETQILVKSIEVSDLPVRTGRFIARKSWIITGSDDNHIRVFNYNTLEKVHNFEAHSDYIRTIIIHPTKPFVLSAGDDSLIKVWDWDNKWQLKQTFEGHTYYIMQMVINPKDNVSFASASLDKTIKVWQFGASTPNFSLNGHLSGVNCVDYYHGGDKPYIISGADDKLIKIWDYQNKSCVATLEGHANNITALCFHPEMPLIISGSEDGSIKMWHSNTFRVEQTLNYGLERVWCISALKGTNDIAVGYDEGTLVIKVGKDEPAVSMDGSGKILWAKQCDVQQFNLKTIEKSTLDSLSDGERINGSPKDMGTSDIFPQSLEYSSNGRYVVACGDGEYIIYTATALRNQAYGSGLDFAWCADSVSYAVKESNNSIKIFKKFKEYKTIKTDGAIDGLSSGPLLAVRGTSDLCFYDFDSGILVRRIEIEAKKIFWSNTHDRVAIATEDTFYILKYDADAVQRATEDDITDDGIESAFTVCQEFDEIIVTAFWCGNFLIYTTPSNRLNYIIEKEIVTITLMDDSFYLLGYIPKDNRIYAADKHLNIVSFKLLLSILEYQAEVLGGNDTSAQALLDTIPHDQHTKLAHFLQKQGLSRLALDVTKDDDHKFELAIQLGDLQIAKEVAADIDSHQKWALLAQAATEKSELLLAGECMAKANDFGGLFVLAICVGSPGLMNHLAETSESSGKYNTSFLAHLTLGHLDECLEQLITLDKLPEASMFAHTYLPSQVDRVVELWKSKVENMGQNPRQKVIADQIALPSTYKNLFPGYEQSLEMEQYNKYLNANPDQDENRYMSNNDRSLVEEFEKAINDDDPNSTYQLYLEDKAKSITSSNIGDHGDSEKINAIGMQRKKERNSEPPSPRSESISENNEATQFNADSEEKSELPAQINEAEEMESPNWSDAEGEPSDDGDINIDGLEKHHTD